ncbi:TetR/AcrR family transcriptional regulator [Bailinhaonella thermotolerans]|uniref:TetR family transcriptional regulator n=1 Tax=Bailinhaonella thermotolerans TaxID=1070861 RepID=A0A3A4ACB2_9ACTN|nr:TetR/AcrR family transcriptional regulator [Bailinhaonella thermotolerans]RJL24174.1 TetR family transcriptional regulator [Bailinhaonella thermotolerans]
MPAPVDHDARRRDVSEAVWRVLAAHGFGGLTLRAVAAEMGCSTGLLTHYFPSKRALVRHALEIADERTRTRARRTPPEEGLPALRAALLDVLCLSPKDVAMNRVWVSSWDRALGDPELGAAQTERYARWRAALRPHAEAAIRLGRLPAVDPDDVVATVAAFAHGLVVQALFDPARFPPERQTALLDAFLSTLANPPES